MRTDPQSDEGIERLEEAVATYRGSFLEGFSLADTAPFEDWSGIVRENNGSKSGNGGERGEHDSSTGLGQSIEGTICLRVSQGVGKVNAVINSDSNDHGNHHNV